MKIRQKKAGKHSIKKQWYVFYFSVLIIPLLVMLFAYHLSYAQLSEAVYDRQMAYLTQMRELMDSQASGISSTMLSFAVNEQIREAVGVKDPAAEMQMPLFRSILSQISNASMSNDLVGHYALYFQESDYLIDENYLIPRRVISWRDYEGAIGEKECSLIVDTAQPAQLLMTTNKSGSLILYTKTSVYRTNKYLYTAAVLSTNELVKRLGSGADNEQAAVAIAGQDGRILVTNSQERFAAYQKDSQEWFFAQVESEVMPLRFLYISPTQIVEAKLITYRYMLYSFAGAALLLGIIAIWFVVQRQYAPVERLMQHFASDQESLSNEYKNISDYLLQAQERNDHHFMTDLLLGNVPEVGSFPYQALLLVSPVDEKQLANLDASMVQQILPGARSISVYEHSVLIFQHHLPNEQELSHTVSSLLPGTPVYLVYTAQGGQSLHEAYANAVDTLASLRFFRADPTLLYRVAGSAQEQPLQIMGSTFEDNIRSAIFNQNEEKAWTLMKQALTNMKDNCHSGSLLRGSLYAISILFMRLEATVRAQNPAVPDGVSGDAVRGYRYTDVDTLTEGTHQAIHDLIASLELQNTRKSTTLYDQIEEYIQQHYGNPDLNVDMIADHFNFSAVYIRRVYKQGSGNSITDALLKKRIEAAKVALQNPASRVNDVALSVGFLETGTFIRGFKKLEGTTPGAYKNQIHEIGIMDIEQEEENTK